VGANSNGGSITISANDKIILAGGVDSTTNSGKAGDITLTAPNQIEVNYIKAQAISSGGGGGNVDITTASFGVLGTLKDPLNNETVQISTAGVSQSGSITFTEPVTLTRDLRLRTGSGNITFDGTLNGNQLLRLDAGTGTIQFNDIVGGVAPLSNLEIINAQNVEVAGGIITGNRDFTFNTPVILTDKAIFDAGTATIGFNSTLAAGGNNLTLKANEIDFRGGANSVTGTGILQLQPTTLSQNIAIAGSDNATASLDLTANDLAALQDGFNDIKIGSNNGSGTITVVNDVEFKDPLMLQTSTGAGEIVINGAITGIGNASITLDAPITTLNADITTASQDITLGNVLLGADVTLDTSCCGGDIIFNGTVDNNQKLTVNAGTGTTRFDGIVGGTTPLDTLSTDAGGTTRINRNITANKLEFNDALEVASDLTLTAAEIDFGATVTGAGRNLVLHPLTPSQKLNLTGTTAFQNGFTSITIGQADGSGAIALNGNFTFNDPVLIQSPIGSGSIAATEPITGLSDASITLMANQNITTNNITANGGITLSSKTGTVSSGNLNSSGANAGGNITVSARNGLTTGQINSRATSDNGGNVKLDSENDIQVASINAQGGTGGTGGNVDISTDKFFRATGTFTDQNGLTASLSTAGGTGDGSIIIRHDGGARLIPFDVGDATTNGTAGAITTGSGNSILPFQSFPGPYTQGDIQIITAPQPLPPQPQPLPPQPQPLPPQLDLLSALPQADPPLPLTLQADPPPPLPIALNTNAFPVEEFFTRQYEEYLGLLSNQILTLGEIKATLNKIEAATGEKPALVYAVFYPGTLEQETQQRLNNPIPQDSDQLQLVVVTGKGEPIFRPIPGATRANVLAMVTKLRGEITNQSKLGTTSYLAPAQQIYQWLIAPIEENLQTQGIKNLAFIMDVGLRSVPLIALHDGKQFLIEKYSAGLMPSLSLTDTRYRDIKEFQILAMGASKFTDENPLPAVPFEVATITQKLWQGKFFLNDAFTLENLKAQRRQQPFGIIHLATHGQFKAGKREDSYIRLWDRRLGLDQLRELGWNDPPVELLVLSACRTALGDKEAELGFAGLAVQAGVKSAVGSLWYVSDEATLGLMAEFYRQLQKAPIKSDALRLAQLAMIRGEVYLEGGKLHGTGQNVTLPPELAQLGDKKLSHPYYWSAFTMIGSPW
jgi:CHAT domain-containing protein